MRKRYLLMVLLLTLIPFQVFAEIPVTPNEDAYVFDYGNVLSEGVEERLNANSRALDEATGAQIYILTIDTIDGMDPSDFGTKVIRQWGIGQKDLNNGVLIYTTTKQGKGNNDVWISVGQGLEGVLPDGKLGRYIDDYMLDYLIEGDFDAAFESIYRVIYDDVSAEYGYENENYEELTIMDVLPIIIIIVLLFAVIILIMKKLVKKGSGNGRLSGWRYGGSIGDDHFGAYDSSDDNRFGGGGGSSGGGGAGRNF